ncbi:MAG TPA: hypothetical protein VMW27_26645 [Thermoanaerobaculia bacterium]|nr:hypothetical protein [Thermoanaerobaculia bacterium]
MPKPIQVTITYNSTPELSIDRPGLSITDEDWVLWSFKNLPPKSAAHIFFPEMRFGPFQSLLMLGSRAILGRGKIDLPGQRLYTYRALVLDASGALATGEASLSNSSQKGNTSPDVLVQCVEQEGQHRLAVEPMNLCLYKGDTATWHVLGIPEKHFVTFAFQGPDPWKKPFEAFSQSQAVAGAGPHQFLAVGAGFSWSQPQLGYTIGLRDGDGQIVDIKDPLIDNLGDPPTGGG